MSMSDEFASASALCKQTRLLARSYAFESVLSVLNGTAHRWESHLMGFSLHDIATFLEEEIGAEQRRMLLRSLHDGAARR